LPRNFPRVDALAGDSTMTSERAMGTGAASHACQAPRGESGLGRASSRAAGLARDKSISY
jgi:hypothetical protein